MKRIRHDCVKSCEPLIQLKRREELTEIQLFLASPLLSAQGWNVCSTRSGLLFTFHSGRVHRNDQHNSTWHWQITLHAFLSFPLSLANFNLFHADNEFFCFFSNSSARMLFWLFTRLRCLAFCCLLMRIFVLGKNFSLRLHNFFFPWIKSQVWWRWR